MYKYFCRVNGFTEHHEKGKVLIKGEGVYHAGNPPHWNVENNFTDDSGNVRLLDSMTDEEKKTERERVKEGTGNPYPRSFVVHTNENVGSEWDLHEGYYRN